MTYLNSYDQLLFLFYGLIRTLSNQSMNSETQQEGSMHHNRSDYAVFQTQLVSVVWEWEASKNRAELTFTVIVYTKFHAF